MPPPNVAPNNLRDIQQFGECLVKVRGCEGGALGAFNSSEGNVSPSLELGITQGPPTLRPQFSHRDVNVNSFGDGQTPIECLWNGAVFTFSTDFIHYDKNVLDAVVAESMAGSFVDSAQEVDGQQVLGDNPPAIFAGTFAPIGTPMGGYNPLYASGNHFMTVWFISAQPMTSGAFPYRFPACYLTGPPLELNIGTERSIARCNWRAIPYTIPPLTMSDTSLTQGKFFQSGQSPSISNYSFNSNGAVLWDRTSG